MHLTAEKEITEMLITIIEDTGEGMNTIVTEGIMGIAAKTEAIIKMLNITAAEVTTIVVDTQTTTNNTIILEHSKRTLITGKIMIVIFIIKTIIEGRNSVEILWKAEETGIEMIIIRTENGKKGGVLIGETTNTKQILPIRKSLTEIAFDQGLGLDPGVCKEDFIAENLSTCLGSTVDMLRK
jgi:hypothetical protein